MPDVPSFAKVLWPTRVHQGDSWHSENESTLLTAAGKPALRVKCLSVNEELERLIKKVAHTLKNAGAREVYLFGSAARGALRENSDLDFAVAGLAPESYFKAMGEAGDAAGRTIDLVDLDEDNPFTRYLKKEGELKRVA